MSEIIVETVQDDFVSRFVNFHSEYESPKAFWKWAAYAAVGSMLRHNVFYQHGNMKIFPNAYIILLADSAQFRKGHPIEVVRGLLTKLHHTKVFSGTASIQAILDLLSQESANKNSGVPIRGGAALITADELAAFFVADPRLIPLLTDIWTSRDTYEYHLRSTNSIKIDNLCVSMLSASNEIFLREVYDSRAVYGGLLGRTFMVKPDETRPANSLMNETKTYDEAPLINGLQKIRELKGKVRFSDDAKVSYKEWYDDLYAKYKTHPDKTGVIQRMHTQAIKIAIILAASSFTLEISKQLLEDAILEVTNLKQNYELYVMSSGQSNLAQVGAKFLAALFEKSDYKLSRKEFLMRNWSEVTAEDFDKLITTLMQGGMIEPVVVDQGEVGYKLTPKCLETLHQKGN